MSKQVFEQDGRLGMDKDTFYADVQTGQLSYQQSSLYNQKWVLFFYGAWNAKYTLHFQLNCHVFRKNIVQPVQAYPNEQMNNLKYVTKQNKNNHSHVILLFKMYLLLKTIRF